MTKRYRMDVMESGSSGDFYPRLCEDVKGDLVTYDDHEKELDQVKREAILLNEAQARELERLRGICGEAYQAVGSLSSDVGAFEREATQKALDNLSAAMTGQPLPHETFLPFPSFATPVAMALQQAKEEM